MLAVFWKMKGSIIIGFLEKGATVNSTFYWQMLQENSLYSMRGSLRGAMVKILNSSLKESDFELQSRNYVYFRSNTLGRGMKLLTPTPAMDK